MSETWKDVFGYEKYYMVSNTGKIFSKRRDRLMKTHTDVGGYERLELTKNGIGNKFFIHRLVAKAFLPKDDLRPLINHIDFDTENNNYTNLEWCTQKENIQHSHEYNRMCTRKANEATSKKVYQYSKDGELIATYPSTMEVQRQMDIPNSNISQCCREPHRTARGFYWRYELWN